MGRLRDRFLALAREGLGARLAGSGNSTWKSFFLDSMADAEEATVAAGERNGGLLGHLLGAEHPLARPGLPIAYPCQAALTPPPPPGRLRLLIAGFRKTSAMVIGDVAMFCAYSICVSTRSQLLRWGSFWR